MFYLPGILEFRVDNLPGLSILHYLVTYNYLLLLMLPDLHTKYHLNDKS